jgi:Tol biopolymer transport system component
MVRVCSSTACGRVAAGGWRINLDGSNLERVTPPDLDAFTPKASLDGKFLVLTMVRGDHRQIEVMELSTGKLTPLTTEATDHWNPAISLDGRLVVYHRTPPGFVIPSVERWGAPPGTDLMLLRLAGAFPAFSPDGKRLALVGDLSRLDRMNTDGSARKTIFAGRPRGLFSTSWAHQDERIAFAVGGVFEGAGAEVDLMTVRPYGSGLRQLTRQTGNNGFPSFSPDGKQVVFRSGRSSNKNLYLANSDSTGLRQLTQGEWADTMCDWSRKGDWIVFASDRDGDFDIWLIRPDGSGLHKLIGGGGRNNHPHFSPDSQWVVFTSQRAGYSAEEVSLPFQFQPYGDLFAIRIDGTDLLRLTHNGFEEGTPAWGP